MQEKKMSSGTPELILSGVFSIGAVVLLALKLFLGM